MDDPLVSVIINNYNYGRFLKNAIDSVLNQTYLNIEVIVVDDGSTDQSREVIASYGDLIIPVLKGNGGQASAFNAGFALSRGEVICFLDSDDIFQKNKVEVIVHYFKKNPEIGWFFHELEYMDQNGRFSGTYSICQKSKSVDVRDSIIRSGKVPFIAPATSGLCFRRRILEQILPMPEAIRIISDNYIKCVSLTISRGFYLNEVLAYQRIHGGNAYTGKIDLKKRGYTHCQIAYYLAQHFKESRQLAFKLMASALADLLRARALDIRPGEVDGYLSSLSVSVKVKIYSRCMIKAIQSAFIEHISRRYQCGL